MKLNKVVDSFNEKHNMRIFQFEYEPTEDVSYHDDCISAFDEYDLNNLPKFDVLWYEYRTGSYSGSGYLVGKIKNTITQEDKWYSGDCGHCSCYGPCENVSETTFDRIEKELEDLPEMLEHIKNFIK